jgi:hypothetical protein
VEQTKTACASQVAELQAIVAALQVIDCIVPIDALCLKQSSYTGRE